MTLRFSLIACSSWTGSCTNAAHRSGKRLVRPGSHPGTRSMPLRYHACLLFHTLCFRGSGSTLEVYIGHHHIYIYIALSFSLSLFLSFSLSLFLSFSLSRSPCQCLRPCLALFQRSQHLYGKNVIPDRRAATLLELMWEAAHDTTLIVLMIAGVISLILGATVRL